MASSRSLPASQSGNRSMYCNSRWMMRGTAQSVQSNRNDVDLIQRHLARTIQCVAEFRLESTLLAHRIPRKTSKEEVRALDGSLDRARPVLPRQQFPDVHPRTEAVAVQIFV